METLLHLIRYLRDNVYLRIKYYSDQTQSILHDLLLEAKINVKSLLVMHRQCACARREPRNSTT